MMHPSLFETHYSEIGITKYFKNSKKCTVNANMTCKSENLPYCLNCFNPKKMKITLLKQESVCVGQNKKKANTATRVQTNSVQRTFRNLFRKKIHNFPVFKMYRTNMCTHNDVIEYVIRDLIIQESSHGEEHPLSFSMQSKRKQHTYFLVMCILFSF